MSDTSTIVDFSSIQRLRQLIQNVNRRRPGRELSDALSLLQDTGTTLDVEKMKRICCLIRSAQDRRPTRELKVVLATLMLVAEGKQPR